VSTEATARFTTPGGTLLLVEPEHALPIVHISIILRTGGVHDPVGLSGLTRLTSRMLRMGTRKLEQSEVDERIDAMGAHFGIGCAASYVQIGGAVVAHNLEPFLELVTELIKSPAFRANDLARAKRETLAELMSICDDDRALAARHFRAFTLGQHPYGRSVAGTSASIRRITARDVRTHYKRHFVSGNVIVGMAGAVTPERAYELVEKYMTLPRGKAPKDRVPPPSVDEGRRVLIVDKPDRTQTQIIIGTLGSHVSDPDHTSLQVANVVFGGLFTARLTHEVRSVRGLSYGASSSLGHDRQRELWSMWTFPSAKDARSCIDLQLRLYDDWVKKGVTPSELRVAKNFLIKSHAFEVDTAQKRLDQTIESELFDLPADYHTGFSGRVAEVTRDSANAALRKRLSRRDQAIVVVATAQQLQPQLRKLPRVRELRVVPFDRV
jgi:zinc protease